MKLALPCTFALAALLAAPGLAGAQGAAPPPGTYVYEGGAGSLDIAADGKFRIQTVGANFHTCDVEGRIVQGAGRIAQSSCVLSFKPGKDGLTVGTNNADQCQDNCGARATFIGEYIRPTPACQPAAVSATRKTFKRQYDAKQYAQAQATLAPVLADCEKTLFWIDKGWVRNDLALAQVRAGDKAACLRTLAPLADDAASSDQDIKDGYPPSDADAWLRVVRATRTNLKLCR